MTDLIVRENNLPASLEDLSKFVLVGREKLNASAPKFLRFRI